MKNPTASSASPVPTLDAERESIHREMLSAVAHDLRTPLASIIGSLEVYTDMHHKLSPEKRAALIHVALQEAHRLNNFVTNILDMARLEKGMIKPKRESIEIGPLLDHYRAPLDNREPDDIMDIQAISETVRAQADASLLMRAIGLVMDNAYRYSGKPAKIRVTFGQQDGAGYIIIHDNGAGIPEDQLDAIFSKYTRLDRQTAKSAAGTGLGLAIARAIMRLMNGDIIAANHPEGGALFTLRFPLADIPSEL